MQTAPIPHPDTTQTQLTFFRRTLNKQDLCILFGLVAPSGRCYYDRLREENFTAETLTALEMSENRYRTVIRGRHFTYDETQRIIAHFKFTHQELSEL